VSEGFQVNRRGFLKGAAGVIGLADPKAWAAGETAEATIAQERAQGAPHAAVAEFEYPFEYPRKFRGEQLQLIAFPLGGVAAGSIGLGGRGQLCDWEMRNHPQKGYRPSQAFASIWIQQGKSAPIARVLESRIQPSYEGPSGLDSQNVPGLSRLEDAVFTGEYPLAHIEFVDRSLPVKVELEAFSPFIPHEPDDSGLPVAVLRYRVHNPTHEPVTVSIAYSLENPVQAKGADEKRENAYREGDGLAGLLMNNPGLDAKDEHAGSFALAALTEEKLRISHWTGWPKGRWWNGPLLFWDQFSEKGEMGPDPEQHSSVGVLCLKRTLAPGESGEYPFVLGWHFPNRTPEICGWEAPKGEEKTVIGNWYATRFADAWEAVAYTAKKLDGLEKRTRAFARAFGDSSLPAVVKDAATANISILASTTCFRTADGEFHGFEGSNDNEGCCMGNCLHVWNYETVTPFLFPSFARSLRKSAFGYSQDESGAMHFRQMLPDKKQRWGWAAADGQMGQIVHAWLDWKLSGDNEWLRGLWPQVKKGLEFAWVKNGWDANKDGVMEGVQHNTYDVEFYGPNPLGTIYYLGALRASAEMADAMGDAESAREYRRLAEMGSRWVDANLFNGKYYIQKVRGVKADAIAPGTRGDIGAEDTEHPEYQVGEGCFVDQLVGQYLSDVGGMGPLVEEKNIRTTLESIHRYNFKPTLIRHENVARTYALNDESAVIICDYAGVERPRIPFPYYSEAWTGLEYTVASLMIRWGMVEEGLECMHYVRSRFDGHKRNPWDEAECGHHYARAMSSWSVVVALSGFYYDGPKAAVTAVPRMAGDFRCFWATGNGWGTFAYTGRRQFVMEVLAGTLECGSCEVRAMTNPAVTVDGKTVASEMKKLGEQMVVSFAEPVRIGVGGKLTIEARG
jgi:non-lysosomal glucosylceramidase